MNLGLMISAFVLLVWALAAWGLFSSMDKQVAAIASMYGIPLDDRIRERLAKEIQWTRRWRLAGGAGGATVAAIADLGFNLIALAVGVAAGSILAELFRPRGSPSHVRVASLERRVLTDYVNSWVLKVLGVLGVCVAISAGLYLSVIVDPRVSTLGITCGTLVAAGATVVLATWIARRPVPTGSTEALVSHTIRCTSIISVLGSGITALGVGVYLMAQPAVLADSTRSTLIRHTDNALLLIAGGAILAGLSLSFRSLPRSGSTTASGAEAHASSRSL